VNSKWGEREKTFLFLYACFTYTHKIEKKIKLDLEYSKRKLGNENTCFVMPAAPSPTRKVICLNSSQLPQDYINRSISETIS
jgi:hypothetical protein